MSNYFVGTYPNVWFFAISSMVSANMSSSSTPWRLKSSLVPCQPLEPVWWAGQRGTTSQLLWRCAIPTPSRGWCSWAGVSPYPMRLHMPQPNSATAFIHSFSVTWSPCPAPCWKPQLSAIHRFLPVRLSASTEAVPRLLRPV